MENRTSTNLFRIQAKSEIVEPGHGRESTAMGMSDYYYKALIPDKFQLYDRS